MVAMSAWLFTPQSLDYKRHKILALSGFTVIQRILKPHTYYGNYDRLELNLDDLQNLMDTYNRQSVSFCLHFKRSTVV